MRAPDGVPTIFSHSKWWARHKGRLCPPYALACDDGIAIRMISNRLFVYGTLMRGFDHPMAKLLSRTADFVSPARCRGRLYLVKHYPGLVLSDDPAEEVFGELYRLRSTAELLRELDMYEACGEGFAEPTEYVRQMLAVTSGDDAVSEAWTYIYNWPVALLPRIASGRFLEK
jgi:gamma-glutamylcyclotransferase (GGCT)/AIG2-like uncharacterized protein YtfP